MEEIFEDNQHGTADSRLLERYRTHLIEQDVTPSTRTSILTIAQKFLQWWRKSFVGDEFMIVPQPPGRSVLQEEWVDLREKYLRIASPDHQMRCTHRTDLTAFLGYLTGLR
ncbi:MAG TPA: hypothetical protein VJ654_03300 [Noviherbaspirillum sp.]|nr:hypothetical protein [Noviherbaspirillum sp.]